MPAIGRFITPDPLGTFEKEDPRTINPYVYCTNNPLRYVDPNGKWRTYTDRHVGVTYVTRQSTWGATVEGGVSFIPFVSLGICATRVSQGDITLKTSDWVFAALDALPAAGKLLGISGKIGKPLMEVTKVAIAGIAAYKTLNEIQKSIADQEIFSRMKDAGVEVYRSNSDEEWLIMGEKGSEEYEKNMRLLENITTEVTNELREEWQNIPYHEDPHYYLY
jgi:hypothetical protein